MGISAGLDAAFTALSDVGAGAASLASSIGLPAGVSSTIGSGITGALEQGSIGALESAVSGGNIGKGFLSGAVSGGVGGALGPVLGRIPGIGGTAAKYLSGAAGGALGAAATGGNIGRGALGGAANTFLAGQLSPQTGGTTVSPGGGGTAAPAASSVDLSSAPGSSVGSGDLSAPVDSTLPGTVGAGAAAGGSSVSGLQAPSGQVSSPTAPPAASTPGGDITQPGSFGVTNPQPVLAPATGTVASTGGGLGGFVRKNPVLALSGLSLLARGNQTPKGYSQLQGQADALAGQGRAMQSYLQSGTLPPGFQGSLNAASSAAKASIRSMYASRGESGSSAEQQDLAGVDERVVGQAADIASKLFQSGLSATGMANNLYLALMNEQMQQDTALSGAVGNLAGAMALMGQPAAPGAQ